MNRLNHKDTKNLHSSFQDILYGKTKLWPNHAGTYFLTVSENMNARPTLLVHQHACFMIILAGLTMLHQHQLADISVIYLYDNLMLQVIHINKDTTKSSSGSISQSHCGRAESALCSAVVVSVNPHVHLELRCLVAGMDRWRRRNQDPTTHRNDTFSRNIEFKLFF